MDVGRLREHIAIQRQENVKNPATGGLTQRWQPLIAGLSAEVINISGREAIIGHVLQGVSLFQITIRFRTDILTSDQILWNGLELNIVAPPGDPFGKRQWLRIHASTQAPQGA